MSIDWLNIRPLNGSQRTAFEELCCQLAESEKASPGSTFIRKGAPDAGIECYWKLCDSKERGWQAKFFLSSPDANQWSQIDGSVKTALEKHPNIEQYTICLPLDRQDPRKEKEEWFMDKWNGHADKWRDWAKEKGMSVEFGYWGEYEIWERLSREEHRGRYFFWFNKDLFSHLWFENRISEAISNAGPRYTPELNVELPVAKIFEGLGRTSEFYDHIKIIYGDAKRAYSKHRWKYAQKFAKDELESLDKHTTELLLLLQHIDRFDKKPIDFSRIISLTSISKEIASKCIQILREVEEKEVDIRGEQEKAEGQESHNPSDKVEYERYYFNDFVRKLETIEEFALGTDAFLANTPALLLVGNAGTGKTHLFCDIANQRTFKEDPTVLLLGEHFKDEEPWLQIIRLLGLSCNKEDFLGALEAAAQSSGSRALILIDALNEGEGKKLWRKHLAGFLTILSRYPRIGIAISARSSYVDLLIPDGLLASNKLIKIEHAGFTDNEYQATRTFFDHFGIERPNVPIMVPEFQNPLFLKLFCLGLKNKGLTKIPPGLQGITTIFNFFVSSVNERLSKCEYLDFDPTKKIVFKAVEKIAETMAEENRRWLERENAQDLLYAVLPTNGYENSLFRHLISEGILAEDRFPTESSNEWQEGIHFSYERFSDHLIANYLLDRYLDLENPSGAFLLDQRLGMFLKDEWDCWQNRGLIEAFSIQIPERLKSELIEIAPACAGYQPVQEAFVESLVWRTPDAFNDATLEYINNYVISNELIHSKFLNALLTIASNPKHPYNAAFLHRNLMNFELANRDEWWSIFLHHQWGERRAVDHFVDWAWSAENKDQIDDESIKLCGIALAWFLTTSNRFLRDRATKALVSLLTNRIHILRQILQEFNDVNDPYVVERLFATAYGCAMRARDDNAIAKLAKDIYESIFKNGMPPAHILLRDYARGVIEIALSHGIDLDIDVEKIRPPYKSAWPSEVPKEEDLKKYGEWNRDMPYGERARAHLYDSVMGKGLSDFSHYIIGTDSGFEWSSDRLGEPRNPTQKEIFQDFIQSLTDEQRIAWDAYYALLQRPSFSPYDAIIDLLWAEDAGDEEETELSPFFAYRMLQDYIDILVNEESFRRSLDEDKIRLFDEQIVPFLNEPSYHTDENLFDLSIVQRWILQKVLDLGWTVERFGSFDTFISSNRGREANKPERIGKKYQWIAYHEILARISDNFEFRDKWLDGAEKYEGPWQMHLRDIDPSCLLRSTAAGNWWDNMARAWWFLASYDAWDSKPDDISWLKSESDLPVIEPLIEITDPKDGSKWLVLDAFYKWESPTPPEEERFENPKREIWYMLKSYIVKKPDADELFEWAKQQNFENRWMPESQDIHRVFLGEFYWAPAFKYYNYNDWTRGDHNEIPKEVLVSAVEYTHEARNYDCSIDEGIGIIQPAKWIVDGMNLKWDGIEGKFFDKENNLIAIDPSVYEPGPTSLLIKKDAFIEYLNESGYDIIWTVLGEKNILGDATLFDNWKGRLELNGAYKIYQGKLKGEIRAEYRSQEKS